MAAVGIAVVAVLPHPHFVVVIVGGEVNVVVGDLLDAFQRRHGIVAVPPLVVQVACRGRGRRAPLLLLRVHVIAMGANRVHAKSLLLVAAARGLEVASC